MCNSVSVWVKIFFFHFSLSRQFLHYLQEILIASILGHHAIPVPQNQDSTQVLTNSPRRSHFPRQRKFHSPMDCWKNSDHYKLNKFNFTLSEGFLQVWKQFLNILNLCSFQPYNLLFVDVHQLENLYGKKKG